MRFPQRCYMTGCKMPAMIASDPDNPELIDEILPHYKGLPRA